jgi:hypothetical protein
LFDRKAPFEVTLALRRILVYHSREGIEEVNGLAGGAGKKMDTLLMQAWVGDKRKNPA